MPKQGRISLARSGYSMPVDAPAYQKPPFYYRGVRCISVAYETDVDAAADLLPEPLSVSDTVTAALGFYEYPWSTFGPYNETILTIMCEHKGTPMGYIAHIAVTTEPPMLGGREIWGFPKKLAKIDIGLDKDMLYGTLERPAGVRLASVLVRPERPVPLDQTARLRPASLRVIPAPERDAERPTCAEVIETEVEQVMHESWSGVGSVSFHDTSTLDPWNRLPVKRILGGSYTVYDMTLGFGKVIDRLR